MKQRRERYRRGIFLLNRAWLKLKFKYAYLEWPGRAQSVLARIMRAHLSLKYKERIKLVDCYEEENVATVPSFLSKKRPKIAQRAAKYGFITSPDIDVEGVRYYKDLMSALLNWWGNAVKKDVLLRLKGFQVRAALQSRKMRQCMMNWVLVTPKTSHRRVVWMIKAQRRAHDDYTHKKKKQELYIAADKRKRSRATWNTTYIKFGNDAVDDEHKNSDSDSDESS